MINNNIQDHELNDERYEIVDSFVNNTDVINFIKSVEKIQRSLSDNNIQPEEMYRYLLTLMLNQC
jgi:intein-encoded DNA endonuclease-like protein